MWLNQPMSPSLPNTVWVRIISAWISSICMTASVYNVGICLPSIREVGTQLPDSEDNYLYIYTRQLLGSMDGVGVGGATAVLALGCELQKPAQEGPCVPQLHLNFKRTEALGLR